MDMNTLQEECFTGSQNTTEKQKELTFYFTCKTIATSLFMMILVDMIALLFLMTIFHLSKVGRPDIVTISIVQSIATIVSTIFILYRYTKRLQLSIPHDAITKHYPIHKLLIVIVTTLGISFLFGIGINLINVALNSININLMTPNFELQPSLAYNIVLIIMVCIIAPISEELLFRGLILSALKRFGTTFAVLTTSLLFALVHGNVIQAIPTFILSLFLCFIVLETKSIYSSMLIHFINNTFAMLQLSFQDNEIVSTIFLITQFILILSAIISAIIKRKTIADFIFTKRTTKVRSFFGNWVSIILLLLFIHYFLINITIL